MAALVLCFMASGAMAGGNLMLSVKTPAYDTTNAELIAADSAGLTATYNDTVLYYSEPQAMSTGFTSIKGNILLRTRDTSTATMLFADSVILELQTKLAHDSATTWQTVWNSGIVLPATFDDNDTSIVIPADSLPSCFDYWRMKMTYIVEEDSITSHCTLLKTTTLDPVEDFVAYLIFGDGVGGESIVLRTDRLSSDSLTGVGGAHTGDTLYLATNAAYVEKDTSVAIDALYWEAATTLFHVFGNGEDGSDSSDYVLHWQGSIDGTTWALLDSTVAIADSLPHVDEISLFTPIRWFRAILVARDGNLKDGESFGIVDIYSRARKNR